MQARLPLHHQFDTNTDELATLDMALVLELIPTAAIIYKRNEDEVLYANEHFFELSAYSAIELEKLQLKDLVPDEMDTNPTGESSRPCRLKRADGDIINADLRIFSISLTNKLVVLAFYPPDSDAIFERNRKMSDSMFDAYSMLSQLSQENSSYHLFSRSADIAKKVLNAPIVAMYIPQRSDSQSFNRINLAETFNSEQVPKTIDFDLSDWQSHRFLWQTGEQAWHPLHELAFDKGYQYMVILPIEERNQCQGILVATGLTPIPDVETMRFLALLAKHTCAAFGKLNALENASRRLQTMRHIVQIERGVTENMSEGLIILTPDLKIAEMNSAAETILGYASKEVYLQDVELVLIGNENLATLYKSAQQGISTIAGTNLMLNDRRGNAFLAQIVCVPILVDDKVKSIVLLLRDLSQTEQLLQHSKQLEQRAFLGEVSAVFAHEVKNPINSISTGLQFMGMSMNPEEANYKLVNRLLQDCQRLTHLMDSTLTFAKPVEYQLHPMDLTSLLNNILERWGPRMTRLNIRYILESNPEKALINADARAIEQVFVNLISNSIQAMDSEGGTLSIKIQASENSQPAQYEISVADSGPGIPEELLSHIFEPFLTTKSTGTGLGLAITKRIISAHKGNIFVESYPGGTMFRILLPMAS